MPQNILLSLSIAYHTTKLIMEEDILNYSPTVIFRGTPCIRLSLRFKDKIYSHNT